MRIFYKIIEAFYRFKKIAAIISQIVLILLLMTPNLIMQIFYLLKITMQPEQYKMVIVFVGNIIISQLLLEPLTIFGRIIIYRLNASSMKNMELNPVFHFMHFFCNAQQFRRNI